MGAKSCIDQTYTSDLSLAEIASRLDTAPAVMTRAFKRDFGIAPIVYRNSLRVSDAVRLLALGTAPVSALAKQTGFADRSSFNRQFKKLHKLQPVKFSAYS